MLWVEKLDKATQSPAYLAYCNLIAAAIMRAALGDPSAEQEIVDLQKEQQKVLWAVLDAQP